MGQLGRIAVAAWRRLGAALLAGPLALLPAGAPAEELPRLHLQVVGGLAGVSQYARLEEPFWTRHLPERTGGRLTADIAPFDRSGIRGQESLRLLRLGVISFGTALLGLVATEEPELSAVELPGVSPDMPTLRRVMAAHRPWMEGLLRERHGTELLAIYVYPAQVVFCARPFAGLSELRGRRIRTSSAAQSEFAAALGAVPVVIPFAEIVPAIRTGVVECAITGTLSGWQIGLHEVTSHVHAMALTWGVSIFGASLQAWERLPEAVRELLRRELAELERRVWEAADLETGQGLACATGRPDCAASEHAPPGAVPRAPGRMTLVPAGPADQALRARLVSEATLPRWAERCGAECVEAWNDRVGAALGLSLPPKR